MRMNLCVCVCVCVCVCCAQIRIAGNEDSSNQGAIKVISASIGVTQRAHSEVSINATKYDSGPRERLAVELSTRERICHNAPLQY
jgi:hypothetical protein